MPLTPLKQKLITLWDIVDRTSNTNVFFDQKQLKDTALLVIEDNNTTEEDIKACFDLTKINYVFLSNPEGTTEFFSHLNQASAEGRLLVIYLNCDPHPAIIRTLKQLAETGEYTDDNLKNHQLHPDFRIIVCAERGLIETTISYPYFYQLFGPVITT